jgi:CHAD domain-containing protein
MTANWAAVRRRLAVRRTAHRPPRRGRQVGHGSIVAPLAATLAATVALAVGVALAQAERDRRAAKAQRKRARRFAQLPGEPLPPALRRMTLGQLDLAIELLGGEAMGAWSRGGYGSANTSASGGNVSGKAGGRALDREAIHETRKALKRLRALVRLLRMELGERRYQREYAILRDAARRLAGARDAEVMVDTLDALLQRYPRKLGRRRPLIALRERLAAERAMAARRTLEDHALRAQVLRDLCGLRERAQRWDLPERPGLTIVESDLRRIYRQGRQRMHLLERGKGDAHAMHEWRKRVKDLRYAAEILSLRSIARPADRLGEVLGEEHDLVVLAGLLSPPGRAPFKGKRGKRARKALLKRIARRRRRLRRRALREGERLYRRRPKKFLRRVRSTHRSTSRI